MCTSEKNRGSNARECGEECKDYNECEERFGALRLRRRVRLSVGGHGHSEDCCASACWFGFEQVERNQVCTQVRGSVAKSVKTAMNERRCLMHVDCVDGCG